MPIWSEENSYITYCETRKRTSGCNWSYCLAYPNPLPAEHPRAHRRVYPSPAGRSFGPSEFSIQRTKTCFGPWRHPAFSSHPHGPSRGLRGPLRASENTCVRKTGTMIQPDNWLLLFYIHFTHLKRFPLLLLNAADVAEVPLLKGGRMQEPHTVKFLLHARLPSLSRWIQLFLQISQLLHRAFRSLCQPFYMSELSEVWAT